MEDSEQRKKRLRVSGGIERCAMPGFLLNPLIEAPSTMPSQDRSHSAPRFDYYTDPMSAFSFNKRSTADVHYFPPPRFGGSPMVQYSSPRPESTNPHMLPPAAYGNPVWGEPRGPAHYDFPFHPSSGHTYPSPRFEPSGYPIYNYAQGTTHQPSYRPYPPGYRNSPNPSPGYSNSHNPSQGRGRDFQHNSSSPVSGGGSGQGPNFHDHYSSKRRARGPDSMIEDPWEHLKPTIWKPIGGSLNISRMPENSKPGISKSSSTNREGSSATSVKFSSGSSLAEELAFALYEAVTYAENV